MPSDSYSQRRGQVVVLFALAIVVVLLMGVLAADVGLMVLSKAELQNAVDAAALAGASQLVGFVGDEEKATARVEALALAEANTVTGEPLTLADADISFGQYVPGGNPCFRPEAEMEAGEIIDSIQIRGRRTADAPDGPINLFFASLLGKHDAGQAVSALATQPGRHVMFVMDRSGSMCYDTTNIGRQYAPHGLTMAKSPTGWYWMPSRVCVDGVWQTAWFCAKDDATGATVTSFLPQHIINRMDGGYWRYCCRDDPGSVQSGWLYAPPNVTIYSRYTTGTVVWDAQSYGPVGSCSYAIANSPVEPIASSQNAACAFVDLLKAGTDQAGLVTYARRAVLDHELTEDWEPLKEVMASYDPRGSTATPDGMALANDELIDSGRADGFGQRIMLLLTDGLANTAGGYTYGNPSTKTSVTFFGKSVNCYVYQQVASAIEQQTRRAQTNGVRIYTVSFGDGADQDLMPRIAAETGGAYYYAADHADLTAVFIDIFNQLPAILTR